MEGKKRSSTASTCTSPRPSQCRPPRVRSPRRRPRIVQNTRNRQREPRPGSQGPSRALGRPRTRRVVRVRARRRRLRLGRRRRQRRRGAYGMRREALPGLAAGLGRVAGLGLGAAAVALGPGRRRTSWEASLVVVLRPVQGGGSGSCAIPLRSARGLSRVGGLGTSGMGEHVMSAPSAHQQETGEGAKPTHTVSLLSSGPGMCPPSRSRSRSPSSLLFFSIFPGHADLECRIRSPWCPNSTPQWRQRSRRAPARPPAPDAPVRGSYCRIS